MPQIVAEAGRRNQQYKSANRPSLAEQYRAWPTTCASHATVVALDEAEARPDGSRHRWTHPPPPSWAAPPA
jgi:hypothetical protein